MGNDLGYDIEYGQYGPAMATVMGAVWEDTSLISRFIRQDDSSLDSRNPLNQLHDNENQHVVYTSDGLLMHLSCPLARSYPDARFVLTTRPFQQLWPGFRRQLCKNLGDECASISFLTSGLRAGDCGDECNGVADRYEMACGIYAEGALCHADGSPEEADGVASRDWLRLHTIMEELYAMHERSVRACVPPLRLLELPVATLSDIGKASRLVSFLGCDVGTKQLRFPRANVNASSILGWRDMLIGPQEKVTAPGVVTLLVLALTSCVAILMCWLAMHRGYCIRVKLLINAKQMTHGVLMQPHRAQELWPSHVPLSTDADAK